MPPRVRFLVRPPQDNDAEHVLYPVSLEIRAPWNMPMELSGTFTNVAPEDWPEDGSPPEGYPIQQGSFCKLMEDADALFQGRWETITRTQADGRATVTFGARDKLAVLEGTPASIALDNIAAVTRNFYGFNQYTGPRDVGGGTLTAPVAVRLYQGQTRDGDPWPHTWYPKYDSAAWLPTTGTARDLTDLSFYDTLGAALTNVATEIKLSQDYKAAPQSGFVSITTGGSEEWIAYDGYRWNEADGHFYLTNCVRQATNGWLGSATRIAHNSGDTVFFRIPRKLHFAHPVVIQGCDGTTYTSPIEVISDTHWTLNVEECGVSWQSEPLALGARGAEGGGGYAGRAAYGSLWINAAVYDEDNVGGTALYLGAFLKACYEQGIDALGPGFGPEAPETCTVNNLLSPDIPITNVRVIRAGMTNKELTAALLQDLGLNRGAGKDAVLVQYNPRTDQVDIKYASQAAANSPDYRYTGERSITETLPDMPPSAYIVRSSGNDDVNKLACSRMWHTPIDIVAPLTTYPIGAHKFGDEVAGTPYENVRGWKHTGVTYYSAGGGDVYLTLGFPQVYNITSILGETQYPNLLTDNSDKTGMALIWGTQPAAGNQLFAWCPDCAGYADDQHPDLFRITKCLVSFDMAGMVSENNTTYLLDVQMLGYRDLTPNGSGTPTGPSGAALVPIGLGTGSRIIMPPGVYDKAEPVTWEFDCDDIINGISLYVRKLPMTRATSMYFDSGKRFMLPLIEVAIFAEPYRADIVRATETYSAAEPAGYITAPNTVRKIRGETMGQHNVRIMDIGPASRPAALSLGVLQLTSDWRLSQPRTYVNRSRGMDLGGMPERGKTAQHSDKFEGVVEDFVYTYQGGMRELTITSRNYRTALYGNAI